MLCSLHNSLLPSDIHKTHPSLGQNSINLSKLFLIKTNGFADLDYDLAKYMQPQQTNVNCRGNFFVLIISPYSFFHYWSSLCQPTCSDEVTTNATFIIKNIIVWSQHDDTLTIILDTLSLSFLIELDVVYISNDMLLDDHQA